MRQSLQSQRQEILGIELCFAEAIWPSRVGAREDDSDTKARRQRPAGVHAISASQRPAIAEMESSAGWPASDCGSRDPDWQSLGWNCKSCKMRTRDWEWSCDSCEARWTWTPADGWSAASPVQAGWAASTKKLRPPSGLHYDFIEAGTSDWNTLSHGCANDEDLASQATRFIRTSSDSLRDVRGLAVEPVAELLERLPKLPRVQKVTAALDEYSSKETLHCVSLENIDRYMGQYKTEYPGSHRHNLVDVMWYAKSLATIGSPHPDLKLMLDAIGRPDLMEAREVPVFSWGDLCHWYGVGSVDVVQLDCEGRDCAIIRGIVSHCRWNPDAWPRIIVFEANYLTPQDEIEETLDTLQRHGYKLQFYDARNASVIRQ